ncbi:hypothetical protein DPMN_091912 [Dreissena polymorpha]|uniref:Uncharacterized protein n=1 Tax=Dreissena polymorpha TaxID=45954 RepID=A0A9D4QZN4_DREPO|nr:hypothetical protein DPMN_091912 [Dreissena polymorpha]
MINVPMKFHDPRASAFFSYHPENIWWIDGPTNGPTCAKQYTPSSLKGGIKSIVKSKFPNVQQKDVTKKIQCAKKVHSAPFTSFACNSVASSHQSSASSHDSDFSASTFMSTSMAVLDGEAVDIAGESGSDTGHDSEEQTAVPISIKHANNQSQCPECVKKNQEIEDLKKRLKEGRRNHDGNAFPESVASPKRRYISKTRPEMKMGDFVMFKN